MTHSSNFQLSDGLEFKIWHARCEIQKRYGHNIDCLKESNDKFGGGLAFQADVGPIEVTSLLANEQFQTDNTIDTISSSNATDTTEIFLRGMTLNGGVFEVFEQTVSLDGQNKVPITALARVERGYNNDDALFLGEVHVYEDTAITAGVPDDISKAHLKIDAVEQQSLKSMITVPSNQYFLITNIWGSVARKQATVADLRLRIREQNKVFRTRIFRSITQDSPLDHEFPLTLIARPGSDIVMTIAPSVSNVEAYAGFDGIYMSIVEP